jgi:hypothetical protein
MPRAVCEWLSCPQSCERIDLAARVSRRIREDSMVIVRYRAPIRARAPNTRSRKGTTWMRWNELVPAAVLGLAIACATPPHDDSVAERPQASAVSGLPQAMTTLGGSMSPLRNEFNAHADRWRIVLVVSPTCNECVLGARAVERELMARYSPEKIHASVVWIPMLAGDDEVVARRSTAILARENASHFYDSVQAVGWAYDRGPFAEMDQRAEAALPASHRLREVWEKRGGDRPQWDLYMMYAPGVRWDERQSAPPAPMAWIRHLGRRGGVGAPSSYWRDSLDSPLREGDLYEAMRTMAVETMGPP